MKDRLLLVVKEFLAPRFVSGKPLLVGVSGGPDSTALLHLLQECRQVEVGIAHVDHGWRSESASEAEMLRLRYRDFPFHTCRLAGGCRGEDAAREERLAFFHSIYQRGYQALILGHQRDDQAETVLKRILEGAHLASLGGIEMAGAWHGMPIWRPLLSVPKSEIVAWLREKNHPFFEDPTNADPRFLRARMRAEIFPDLEKKFGKNIAVNLCRLGEHAQEVKGYLSRKIAPLWRAVEGNRVDLQPFFPLERLEVKTFLKQWTDKKGIFLSREALDTLASLIEEGEGRRKVVAGAYEIEIHSRVVAIKHCDQ